MLLFIRASTKTNIESSQVPKIIEKIRDNKIKKKLIMLEKCLDKTTKVGIFIMMEMELGWIIKMHKLILLIIMQSLPKVKKTFLIKIKIIRGLWYIDKRKDR